MTEWNAKRILTEICDAEKRREVLTAFWTGAEDMQRRLATAHLAKSLHFRDETIRKAPAQKKADWLATRLASHEFEEFFEVALMVYHTHNAKQLLAAFLDKWQIPHVDGTIEADDYKTPSREEVETAFNDLKSQFAVRDILLYFASVGLLMGDGWRESAWPVVDEHVGELKPA